MIQVTIGKNTLVVNSRYDSSIHQGFNAYILTPDDHQPLPLTSVLTLEQILLIEEALAWELHNTIKTEPYPFAYSRKRL